MQPIFRFQNMGESFPDLFYLLYGILMTSKNRNKFISGIKVFSKGIEWILKYIRKMVILRE